MNKFTKKKHEEMLYTLSLIKTTEDCGSGAVIYSKPIKKDSEDYETYVLTNYHVIEKAIEVKKEWNTVFQKDIKKEKRATITVEFFKYQNFSRNVGRIAIDADIVAYDRDQDVALLKLRSNEQIKYVVKMHSKNVKDINIYDKVYACGCSLGHPPVPTKGEITSMDDEIEKQKYWMSSSPIIDGNSGGGIFLVINDKEEESYELVGISTLVETIDTKKGEEEDVAHMCYLIPIDRICDWLEEICYQFIFDSKFTSEQCSKMRKKKRKKIEEENNQALEDKEEETEKEKEVEKEEKKEEKQKDS